MFISLDVEDRAHRQRQRAARVGAGQQAGSLTNLRTNHHGYAGDNRSEDITNATPDQFCRNSWIDNRLSIFAFHGISACPRLAFMGRHRINAAHQPCCGDAASQTAVEEARDTHDQRWKLLDAIRKRGRSQVGSALFFFARNQTTGARGYCLVVLSAPSSAFIRARSKLVFALWHGSQIHQRLSGRNARL